MNVMIVAPVPPPYGGMALQAQQLAARLRGDGFSVEVFASNFTLPTLLRPFEALPGVRTAFRAVLIWFRLLPASRRADVVHVFAASWLYFFIVVYPAVIVGRLCRRRVVLNYRGGEAQDFFSRWGKVVAPAFRWATTVTAPSEFLAGPIRERFAVEVQIVANILDLDLFTFTPRVSLRPRLLVTRHLEKIYDVGSIVRAFASIQRQHPDATLWIAGGGSQEASLRELVAAQSLRSVRFVGEVAHRDLPGIYRDCDIYVNASLVDNFPGALLEAAACGLVIVTTGAGGIPYIFEDGRTARIVSPGDWTALAHAVLELLANQNVPARLAAAASATARQCEWSAVRRQLLVAYGLSETELIAGQDRLRGARCVAG